MKKVLPKRDEVLEEGVNDFIKDPYRDDPPLDWYRDFAAMEIQDEAGKEAQRYANMSPKELIDKVMRKGSLNIGGRCKAIKCPEMSSPAVCGIFPTEIRGEEKIICTGPTVEKTKGGLIFSEKTYYDNEPPKDCPYCLHRILEDPVDWTVFYLKRLRNHPDYEVIDAVEKYDLDIDT